MSGKLIVFFMIFALAHAQLPTFDIFKIFSGTSSQSNNPDTDSEKTETNIFDPKNLFTMVLNFFNKFPFAGSNNDQTTPDESGSNTDGSKDQETIPDATNPEETGTNTDGSKDQETIPDATNPEESGSNTDGSKDQETIPDATYPEESGSNTDGSKDQETIPDVTNPEV